MKLLKALLPLLIIAAILGGFALFMWGNAQISGPGPLAETKFVVVERGQGVSAIAFRLAEEGVIRSPFLFKVKARLSGTHKDLKAGEYEFEAHMPMIAVLAKIAAGETYQRLITVPEGLTSWQVTEILANTKDLQGDIAETPAEGTLLPETYDYMRGDTRDGKVAQMQQAMSKALAELWEKREADVPLRSPEEAVILASIVEKETGLGEERARIAGLFYNRLARGMPLQSDPTVIYALTNGKIENKGQGPLGRRLLKKDLEIDSPYNTYKNPGLPPGPIANPGRAALEAVLHPEHNEYLYFVAKQGGGHLFARTLEEHNANVIGWRIYRNQNK